MVQGGKALLHRRGDGAEHKDQSQVHPPHQGAPQHAGFVIKAFYVAGYRMEELVRPGDGQELPPPAVGHIGHKEAEDEGEGDDGQEGIKVFYYTFK